MNSAKTMILVIDDEQAVREAVTDILDLEGLAVISAANGESGVALFRQHLDQVALIILDMSMPGLSGQETLARLRQVDGDVRVLVSSGYSESDLAEQVDELGVAGFLQKPYDALHLIDAVNRCKAP